MQAIHADNVTWKAQARGVREAKIYSTTHGTEETRIDMVEVPSGSYIPPHRHSSRTEFITILASAGAQLQIGERIFRPIAGQVFHREPGDILALTNDSQHPFCYSVVRFGYEASDVEQLDPSEPTEQAVEESEKQEAEAEESEEKPEVEDSADHKEATEADDEEAAEEDPEEDSEEDSEEKPADSEDDDDESSESDSEESEESEESEKSKKSKKSKAGKKSKKKSSKSTKKK